MAYQEPHTIASDNRRRNVFGDLAGDLTAAAVSATLVAPTVTIIDRSLVESASYNKPVLNSLRNNARAALKHPARFAFSSPFGLVWTLYAATYTVANGTETVGKELFPSKVDSITFASTFLVNVPLGVLKDIRFSKKFSRPNAPTTVATEAAKAALQSSSKIAARAATATFLLRDAVTIFGSFTLAPHCTDMVPDSMASFPHAKTIISQMLVPVLSQLVATPLHLLGLDLYSQHGVPWSSRMAMIRQNLLSATAMRCVRIIPAFGCGCLVNMGLRSLFHDLNTDSSLE